MGAAETALFDEPQGIDPEIKDAVLEQLERIRNDKLFRDTTRMKRFLSYVVNEALEGRSKRLKGYSIGLEVFDRPDDFDPQADTIVRVQAGQLRRRLDLYYANEGKKDPVRFVIPKGQYAPSFEMRRSLPEEVIETESQRVTDEIISSHLRSRPGIAVFTFEDLSQSDEQDYFAEGLTTEIINALVQFRYLRIVASTPNFGTVNGKVDQKEFAKKYDVQFILTGSVRRIDDVFRVSVSLISSETGEHIFTRIFDKQYEPSNIFDIQEEIASYTAAQVAAPFGVVNRFNRRTNLARAVNMPAYQALLKFYEVKLSPTMEKGLELLKEFELITDQHSGYSSAWAIRSILNVVLCTQSIHDHNTSERLSSALEYAGRATSIDPDNSLGFMALYMSHYHLGQFERAEKMAQRAMALNPNDYSMLAYYAITNAFRNDTGRAVSYQNAAMRLIDRPPIWFYLSELILAIREGRYKYLETHAKEMSPKSPAGIHIFQLAAMGHLDRKVEAEKLLVDLHHENPNYDKNLLELFLTWQPDTTLKEIVFEGWRRVGLDI